MDLNFFIIIWVNIFQIKITKSRIPTNDRPKKTPKVPPMFPKASGKVTLASLVILLASNLLKLTWTKDVLAIISIESAKSCIPR